MYHVPVCHEYFYVLYSPSRWTSYLKNQHASAAGMSCGARLLSFLLRGPSRWTRCIIQIKISCSLFGQWGANYLPLVTGDRVLTIALHLQCPAILLGLQPPVPLGSYFETGVNYRMQKRQNQREQQKSENTELTESK